MVNNGWIARTKQTRAKASWAAVALALISCVVQGVNFVRTDLKPLLEASQKNTAALERIERRLEDHERRLVELEKVNVSKKR